MKRYAIITAGGIGRRMKTQIPKQFLNLQGKPVLMHTIERFYSFDSKMQIIVSLPKQHISDWQVLCNKHEFSIEHKIEEGGKTRFHSIKNALDTIHEDGIVAVHDGVRPLVSTETIEKTFETAEKKGNAVASTSIDFSLRQLTEKGSKAVHRDLFREIQTPQTFRIHDLQDAYNLEYNTEFTDDASVFEAAGYVINLVEGNKENIKITSKKDLLIAENLLNAVR